MDGRVKMEPPRQSLQPGRGALRRRYIAFNKPFEVLSQFTDLEGRQTLASYVPIPGIYAAGRLDYRSEGLLLLTDDGPLIQRLTDPSFQHTKTYLAQVEGLITTQAVEILQTEIVLPGLQTRLPQVSQVSEPGLAPRPVPVRAYHPTSWLMIKLQEGKKHQVRRMTAAVGFPTLRLVRIAIGPLELGELKPGKWRELTPAEVQSIQAEGRLRSKRPNTAR
jgi:23S rRNA pseudouridine2457 synthase